MLDSFISNTELINKSVNLSKRLMDDNSEENANQNPSSSDINYSEKLKEYRYNAMKKALVSRIPDYGYV